MSENPGQPTSAVRLGWLALLLSLPPPLACLRGTRLLSDRLVVTLPTGVTFWAFWGLLAGAVIVGLVSLAKKFNRPAGAAIILSLFWVYVWWQLWRLTTGP